MRSFALIILLVASVGAQERKDVQLEVPSLAEIVGSETSAVSEEMLAPVEPAGRLWIPSDPHPNREPACDEIVLAKKEETSDSEGSAKLAESLKEEKQDDGVRVSVLGYHEFSTDLPDTAMRIQTSKFRRQMEALLAQGKPVVSMEDFVKWKKGEGTLPPQCFLITIDDGWKSVYTDAYPIFKEFKVPFTIFLYKNYVDGGGRALTTKMIQEMLASGLCTVGSHSVSHPYPSQFRAVAKKGKEAYENFLTREFAVSKSFLEGKFEKPVTTYAYPGGYVTEEMIPVATAAGYEHLFTVNPGMTRRDSDDFALPRFIILGNHDGVFELATTFRATLASAGQEGVSVQTTKHPVLPEPGAVIANRLPLIAANLSQEPEVDPESLVMRMAGFGKVPAIWNAEDQTFSWQVNRPLRVPISEVTVQWRLKDHREYELPMRWSFRLDLESAYQPR